MSKNNCCVVGCSNTYKKSPGTHFYKFPVLFHERERRWRWIAAVRRRREDGSPWEPTKNSRICSQHFINGERSNDPRSPAYVPTIFPSVCGRTKHGTSKSYQRLRAREQKVDSITDSQALEDVMVDCTSEEEKISVGSQTDPCDWRAQSDTPSLFLCCLQGCNAETQVASSVCIKVEPSSPRTTPPHDVTCADVKQEFTMPNSPLPLLSLVMESVDIKVEPRSPKTMLPPAMTYDDIKDEIEVPNSPVMESVDIKVEPASPATMLATECLDMIDKEPSESSALQPCSVVVTPLTCSTETSREVPSMESNLRIPGCTPATSATWGKQFQLANLSGHEHTHKPKNFQCRQCSAMLGSKWSLQRHMLTHSCERPYECGICGMRFKRNSELVVHRRTHMDDRKFKCELCPSAFCHKVSLERHKELHERGVDMFPCQECGKIFRQNEKLQEHLRRHMLEKRFACHLCPAKFMRQSQMDVHVRKHTGERPFKCSICEKSFRYSHTCTVHMRRIHRKVKPKKEFPCSACGKVFFQQANLSWHERTHKIKSFQCSHCSVTVASKSLLNRHMLTHSCERLHKCSTCAMRFKRNSELIRHRSIHMVEKKFKCELFPSAFHHKASLKRHKEFHERGVDIYHCQECEKTFLRKKNLQEHRRRHMLERPFACRLCPAKFLRKDHMETHVRGHTDKKPHKCSVCEKSFTQSHMCTLHMHRMHHDLALKEQLDSNDKGQQLFSQTSSS